MVNWIDNLVAKYQVQKIPKYKNIRLYMSREIDQDNFNNCIVLCNDTYGPISIMTAVGLVRMMSEDEIVAVSKDKKTCVLLENMDVSCVEINKIGSRTAVVFTSDPVAVVRSSQFKKIIQSKNRRCVLMSLDTLHPIPRYINKLKQTSDDCTRSTIGQKIPIGIRIMKYLKEVDKNVKKARSDYLLFGKGEFFIDISDPYDTWQEIHANLNRLTDLNVFLLKEIDRDSYDKPITLKRLVRSNKFSVI